MTAMTLIDYAADPNPLVSSVARVMHEDSPFFGILPFEDVGALAVKVNREPASLPTIAWRRIGNAHSSVKAGRPTEAEETAYSIGNYIDIDKALLADRRNRLVNPMTHQTQMTSRGIARAFTDCAINNTPALNADAPVGLFYRIMNDVSGQHLNANGLDISADASGLAANIQTFLDWLDKLIYACEGHKADILLINDTLKLRVWSTFRQSGLVNVSRDELGREFLDYKGAKLVDMGFKADDSTYVITNVELNNGTALTGGGATSVYAVRLGKEYFTGWQEYKLTVSDPVLTDDQVTYRSVVDWVVGLALSGTRSVARLSGVIAA